jgi:centrosomin
VENEAYRNELMEKQELLCQAAKAMELMEDTQKSSNEQNQITIDELNHKLELLEIEMKAMEK